MRRARFFFATVLTLAFAFPFLATVWFRADPLILANETVAYRFFYAERLLHGEGASIWVLAGFLTTALQTAWLAVLNLVYVPSVDNLSLRLHLFSYGYSFLVVALGGIIFFQAAANRRLAFAELMLLALPALGPAYLTRTIGFYYYYLPDYYHLNVLLTVAAVWGFVLLWTDERSTDRPLWQVMLVGFFVGLIGGNKITMFIIGSPLLALLGLEYPLSWFRLLLRGLAGAVGVVAGFLGVFWWFYLFNFSAVLGMFSAWSAKVQNPGGESNFWSSEFHSYLTNYSYGYIILLYLAILACTAILAGCNAKRRWRALVLLGALALGGLAWCYFVYKRPAGTTFFEGSVALLGFSAMALALCARLRVGRWLIAAILVAATGYATDTFAWRQNLQTLRGSRSSGQSMWRLHHDLLEFAHGRSIIVIFPENSYGYSGVAEFLLKGSSDMPSWQISEHGQFIIDRYAPHLSFWNQWGSNAKFPANSVLFWVDVPGPPPMIERFQRLKDAYERPDAQHLEWSLPIEGTLRVHAVALPKESAELGVRVLAGPPEEFSAARMTPTTVKLFWDADGRAQITFEIRTSRGIWEPLGWANATANRYQIDGLSPQGDYIVRARKEFAGQSSAWVEARVPATAP